MNKELNELLKMNGESERNHKENAVGVLTASSQTRCEAGVNTEDIIKTPNLAEEKLLDNIGESILVENTAMTDKEVNTVSMTPLPDVDNQLNLKHRKDSSCQTNEDIISQVADRIANSQFYDQASVSTTNGYAETRTVSLGTSPPNFKTDASLSPHNQNTQPLSDRSNIAGMRRSLSRLSLNYGLPRHSESRQQFYQSQDWAGYGYGEPLYRSISQSSLTGEPDVWGHDIRGIRKPDYYLSVEELVERRRQEAMRAQGLEIVRMIREAEQKGFTADDLQVALNNCGKSNPIDWLENNWKNMVETVVTLATNYGHDKRENDIGIISSNEAREALRMHKGNIWAAVTECVESRQRKYLELSARGNFTLKETIAALTANQGSVELAYAELTKSTLKPFLMHIWGPGSGVESESGTIPHSLLGKKQSDLGENSKQDDFTFKPYETNSPTENQKFYDYQWNDERSDISGTDFDEYEDNYEYENSYDYMDNLSPNSNKTLSKDDDGQDFYNTNIETLKQKYINNEDDKKEKTAQKKSGFLSRLAAFTKTTNNLKKEIGGKKVIGKEKREEINKEYLKKTDSETIKNVLSQDESKNGSIPMEETKEDISKSPNTNDAMTSRALKTNESYSKSDLNQQENKNKTLEKKNLSFTSLLQHFSSNKSRTENISSSSSKEMITPTKSNSSVKETSIPNKEISESSDSESDEELQVKSDSSELTNQKEAKSISKISNDYQISNEPVNELMKSTSKDNKVTNTAEGTSTVSPKSDLQDAPTQTKDQKNVSELSDTTKVKSETSLLSNGTLDDKKSDSKDFQNSTGTIIKKSPSKKSETSAISKTISKFNFISNKSSESNKKSPEILNTNTNKFDVIASAEKKTPTQKLFMENSTTDTIDDNNQASGKQTPDSDKININTEKSKDDKGDEPRKQNPPFKKERSDSPLEKKSYLSKFSGKKPENKNVANEKHEKTKNEVLPTSPTFMKKEKTIGKRNWIDLSPLQKSNQKQLAFERKVRRLLAEEHCATYEQAEIAVKLIEMDFNETDVIEAMKECTSLEQAFTYLQQDCELCVGIYPASKMVSMIHCAHRACEECLRTYFTIQIRDRNIRELMCPYCNEPDLENEDIAMDYFNHLDILLKRLVEPDIHELFQQKLRDRVLMKDPNFRWCSQCSSGFIAFSDLKKLVCPDCKAVTCAKCRKLWEKQHDGISCEQFLLWKEANDPETQAAGLAKHLTENGIDCPNCKFRYSLAKGGCMHFRCIQCQYDFCSGCGKPFKMGQKCTVSEFCAKLGLHAHHPRNCLFYLRDKDPVDLQKLLEENNIPYNTEPSEGTDVKDKCQVMEQKETPQGMKDDICGKDVEDGYAGLCRLHFIEYLVSLVNQHHIDPLPVLDQQDLQLVLRRAQHPVPERDEKETEQYYRETLMKLIQEKVPLDKFEES